MDKTQLLTNTKGMIDRLKSCLGDAGLSNSSSEYQIITETFLFKFLHDKFLHDLSEKCSIPAGVTTEEYYLAMDDKARAKVMIKLPNTATIRPEWMISRLFNHKIEEGFSEKLDEAMLGVAADNADIFSVHAGDGTNIRLFSGISRHVTEIAKRDPFAESIIEALSSFSFEGAFAQSYDFFADVFEYLISDYNKDSGEYGEYFTPHSIATIIARVLVREGDANVTVYDPASGTGTLLLAVAHQIGEDACTIYAQDRSQKANEFLRLNLILNDLVHSLPNVVQDDTLKSPGHKDPDGSVRKFDYIVSNPPFKVDFSKTRNELAGEKYSTRFWAGVPNIPNKNVKGMAIYLMFLQHIIVSLKPGGRAAFVVPTGFLTAKGKIEKKIRQRLVERKMLRGVISMPSNIFANTGTNVSVVFIDSSKEYDHALLMDASKLGEQKKAEGTKNKRTYLRDFEMNRIVDAFNAAEEIEDFSVLASYEDIEAKNCSFSAGQYFDVKIDYVDITPEEFSERLANHVANLEVMFAEGEKLQKSILGQLEEICLD